MLIIGFISTSANAEKKLSFSGADVINVSNNWSLPEERMHLGFSGMTLGPKGEIFLLFRAAWAHGVTWDEKGGDLYVSRSLDEGVTWSQPTIFATAEYKHDLRDISISYDYAQGVYYVTYVDHDLVSNTLALKILKGADPLTNKNWVDVYPESNMLFNKFMATYHPVVRRGPQLFLPVYGYNEGESKVDGQPPFQQAILSANGLGQKWSVLSKFNNLTYNESTLYFSLANNLDRWFLISRPGLLRWSDDNGQSWTKPIQMPFNVSGGPRVFDMGAFNMLIARDDSLKNSPIYASFSEDGTNWSKRVQVAASGHGYASTVTTFSGKKLLLLGQEYGRKSNLILIRLIE